jgi:hypothetical protein
VVAQTFENAVGARRRCAQQKRRRQNAERRRIAKS